MWVKKEMERGFDELKGFGQALEVLIEHPKEFEELFEAVKLDSAERIQAILEGLKIYRFCWWFCRWFCYVVYVLRCNWFCTDFRLVEVDFKRVMELAKVTVALHKDEKAFNQLVEACKKQDKKMWNGIIQERKWATYCIPICEWIKFYICYWRCKLIFCRPVWYEKKK